MKIIFLEAAQNFGGSKRSVIDISAELIKAGHDVLIVDFWGANKEFIEAAQKSNIPLSILQEEKPFIIKQGGKVKKIKNIMSYSKKRLNYKRAFESVVKDFQPDYVCVNALKTLDILSNEAAYKIDYFVRGWSLGSNFKIKFYLKKFDIRFIAISEATRHAIHIQNRIPLSEILVVKAKVNKQLNSSIDNKVVLNFDEKRPIKILHAGTFVETKGHHIAVLVAHGLKKQGIHFKMRIAGLISPDESSKIYFNKLVSQTKRLGLSDDIQFIVDNHDLSGEMKNADVLINPSYTEGLSRVCLEAMSFGVPVISNPVGGVTDFVIDNYTGYLTDFNRIDLYVEYITKYYDNPDLLKKHSLNACDVIESGYLSNNIEYALKKAYPIDKNSLKICS